MTLVASALAGGACIDDADALRAGGTERVLGCTVGSSHVCGLRADGSQASPPDGEFASVSAGGAHSCGVRGAGTAECGGWDDDG